jgi:hypothetical protein
MGFPLAIDQGDLAKIVQIAPGAHLGLVDEAQGHEQMGRQMRTVCASGFRM